MAGSSPVVVDRRNGPDNGRELREAVSMVCLSWSTIKIHTSKHSNLKYLFQSLAVHTRHQRQGVQQRIQNAVQSSAESFVSTYANNAADRQAFRERQFEEDLRQKELDREERSRNREAADQRALLMAGCISRIVTAGSAQVNQVQLPAIRRVQIQFYPEEGPCPLPLAVNLNTKVELIR